MPITFGDDILLLIAVPLVASDVRDGACTSPTMARLFLFSPEYIVFIAKGRIILRTVLELFSESFLEFLTLKRGGCLIALNFTMQDMFSFAIFGRKLVPAKREHCNVPCHKCANLYFS